MTKRKCLSKKTRFEIFKRDGFICQYCGNRPPETVLEIDHIIPVFDGGGNNMDNLVTSCFDCNRGKSANSLKSIPKSLKDKASETIEAEAQLKEYSKIMQLKADRIDREAWLVVDEFDPDCDGFDKGWLSSIKFYISKLGCFDVLDAMNISVSRFPNPQYSKTRTMKYFHGVCKRKISEICDG